MSKSSNIVITLFLGIFYIPFLGFMFFFESSSDAGKTDETISDHRTTTHLGIKIPVFDDKLRQATEKLLINNLLIRSPLLDLYSDIKYRVFGVSPTDKVLIGKDGWLFYKGSL